MTDPANIKECADAWVRLQLSPLVNAPLQDDERAANEAEDQVDEDYKLYELAFENPNLAFDVIRDVIDRYDLKDLQGDRDNEARTVLGVLGAGPLEDLLSYHGNEFIGRVEAEADRNPKFRWVLRQVAQNSIPDDVWHRIQKAN